MASQPHIEIADLTMAYGSYVVMRDLNFEIDKGEITIETRHTFPQIQGHIKSFINELTKVPVIEGELIGPSDVGQDRLVVSDPTRSE